MSPEFKELQQNLERERPFTVIHGGVLMEREDYEIILDSEGKESFQRDPFGKLRSYCRKAGYRLIDLFRDLDKDSSMTITKDELINGLKVVIILVTMCGYGNVSLLYIPYNFGHISSLFKMIVLGSFYSVWIQITDTLIVRGKSEASTLF